MAMGWASVGDDWYTVKQDRHTDFDFLCTTTKGLEMKLRFVVCSGLVQERKFWQIKNRACFCEACVDVGVTYWEMIRKFVLEQCREEKGVY